jgi:predicted dehydrogenase
MSLEIKTFEVGAKVIEETNTRKTDRVKKAGAKIRAGIVGAGLMGRWHAEALEKVGGTVIGVADFDIKKAQQLASRYSNARAFTDIEKMLSSQKIDVLHICSPTGSHEEIAEIAIKAGVNLLIEKPIAATADKTTKLYDLAKENNTLLCPVHQFAFQDGVKKAQTRLPDIGRIVHLEAHICSAGGVGLNDQQVTQIAIDVLPHPLSLIQKFLKCNLSDFEWNMWHPAPGELRAFSHKEKMASLSIFISMNSRPTVNSFHLYGEDGTIHLNLFHGYAFIEPGKTSRFRKILHPFDLATRNFSAATGNLIKRFITNESAYPGLRQLTGEFYESFNNDKGLPISPAEAIGVAEIRDLLIDRAGIK